MGGGFLWEAFFFPTTVCTLGRPRLREAVRNGGSGVAHEATRSFHRLAPVSDNIIIMLLILHKLSFFPSTGTVEQTDFAPYFCGHKFKIIDIIELYDVTDYVKIRVKIRPFNHTSRREKQTSSVTPVGLSPVASLVCKNLYTNRGEVSR